MTRPSLSIDRNPSDRHCPACVYLDPCLALSAGRDAEAILRSRYGKRPPQGLEEGRLGGGAWGMGRGAAPPKFRGSPGG